MFILDN